MGLPIASEFVAILVKNPIIAWFLLLFILAGDFGISTAIAPNGSGLVGYIISNVLGLFGVNMMVNSFQIMIIVAITPVIIYAAQHSGRQ